MVVGRAPCHVTRQMDPDDDNSDDGTPPLHQQATARPPCLMTSYDGARQSIAWPNGISHMVCGALVLADWDRYDVRRTYIHCHKTCVMSTAASVLARWWQAAANQLIFYLTCLHVVSLRQSVSLQLLIAYTRITCARVISGHRPVVEHVYCLPPTNERKK